ncbi:MAG: metallophosphoesterase [Planctomycetota bacterium]
MSARLIAIGDIHGCDAALAAVVDAIAPTPEDQLIFLGDYVDRGPDSSTVIDRLIHLRETVGAVTILGNHEEMMLGVIRGDTPAAWWLRCGGVETLDSYGGGIKDVPAGHIAFLESCVDFYEAEDFFFVHANYVADEPLGNQPTEALRWQSLDEHFPKRHASGRTAIMGHTSQKSGDVFDAGHLRCIDTFCHGGGWLTAMEVRTGQLWQADRTGRLSEGEAG